VAESAPVQGKIEAKSVEYTLKNRSCLKSQSNYEIYVVGESWNSDPFEMTSPSAHPLTPCFMPSRLLQTDESSIDNGLQGNTIDLN
jgi:hypothetical protein